MRYLVTALILMASQAFAQQMEGEKRSGGDKVSSSLYMQHYQGVTDLSDPLTYFRLKLSYPFLSGTIGIQQEALKYYVVNPDQEEFEPLDTEIHYKTANWLPVFYGGEFDHELSLTLPVSRFSRENDVRTRLGAMTGYTREFFAKKLSLRASLDGFYQVNAYDTTRTGTNVGGGRPLPHYRFGGDLMGTWSWPYKLSSSLGVGYDVTRFHENERRNQGPEVRYEDGLIRESYLLWASVDWEATDFLSLGLGYDHSNSVEKTAGLGDYFYLYDDYASTYYVSSNLRF